MPRSGGGTGPYQLPAIYLAIPGTTILSVQHNTPLEDIANEFNQVYPVPYGGTGQSTIIGAADAFSTSTTAASAGTVDLGNVTGVNVTITGTVTITSFGSAPVGAKRWITFTGILTLTHNGTSLILPGAANIVTASGDTAEFVSLGAGNWRCIDYQRASGYPVVINTNTATVLDTLRNRVVNGDKLVSQENGQTSGTTNGRYLSDQNAMYFVSSAGTFTGVNSQTLSPSGGYRDRITITVADAALAAGEFLTYTQNLEGSNVRDAKWGTAGAVPIVVRRGFKFPAGTYTVAFHNSGATRSYVTSFVISAPEANTDVVRTFAIPGDTTGTWLSNDGVIGLTMDVVIAAGTTFQTTANAWQAGNFLTIAGTTNGMGTAAAVFEFFDEGIRLDPNATGVYGNYQSGPADAVYQSGRYYRKNFYASGESMAVMMAYSTAGAFGGPIGFTPGIFCKTPAVDFSALSHFSITNSTATNAAPSALTLQGAQGGYIFVNDSTRSGAGLGAGNAAVLRSTNAAAYIAANARL